MPKFMFTKEVEVHVSGEAYVKFDHVRIELTADEVRRIIHLVEVLKREGVAYIHEYDRSPVLLGCDESDRQVEVEDRNIDCVQRVVSSTNFWWEGLWCDEHWNTDSISVELLEAASLPEDELPKHLNREWRNPEAHRIYRERLTQET